MTSTPSAAARETEAKTARDQDRALRDDVRRVREDLDRVKEDLSAVAHSGLAAIQHRAEDAVEKGRDAGRYVAGGANDAHRAFCQQVAAHPTTSVLVAMGVGALLARLIPKR